MYTTKQFDKDVEELRRLIKMCDEVDPKTGQKHRHINQSFQRRQVK